MFFVARVLFQLLVTAGNKNIRLLFVFLMRKMHSPDEILGILAGCSSKFLLRGITIHYSFFPINSNSYEHTVTYPVIFLTSYPRKYLPHIPPVMNSTST